MAGSGSADRILIVNADDLGLHTDINRGIEKAHREGIVTSASFSVVGEAFEDGVATCARCPHLDIGLHLTLVEERPLSPAKSLGGLARADGRFPKDHSALVGRLLMGRVSGKAVRGEIEAQLAKLLEVGIRPSHLDAHQHVHLLPTIWPAVVELALENDIRWIRVPRYDPIGAGTPTPTLFMMRSGLNVLQSVRRASLRPLRSPDSTPALGHSGHLSTDRILRGLSTDRILRGQKTDRILRGRRTEKAGGGVAELVAHPGVTSRSLQERYRWGYDWSGETAALTDPELRTSLEREGYSLCTFADMAA